MCPKPKTRPPQARAASLVLFLLAAAEPAVTHQPLSFRPPWLEVCRPEASWVAHRAGSLGRGPRLCHNDLMISHICGFGSSNSRSPVRGPPVAWPSSPVWCLGWWLWWEHRWRPAWASPRVGPRLAGASSVSLHGVSCPAGGNCVGVGYFLGNNPDQNGQFLASDTLGAGRRRCRPFQRGGWPGTRRTRWGPSPARWPGPVPPWGPTSPEAHLAVGRDLDGLGLAAGGHRGAACRCHPVATC